MTILPDGNFKSGIKKIVLVPDGIVVPTTCAIQTISFANKFYQIAFVGTSIILLYYRDAPVVGSMNTLD